MTSSFQPNKEKVESLFLKLAPVPHSFVVNSLSVMYSSFNKGFIIFSVFSHLTASFTSHFGHAYMDICSTDILSTLHFFLSSWQLLTKYFHPPNTGSKSQTSAPDHEMAINNTPDTEEEHSDFEFVFLCRWVGGWWKSKVKTPASAWKSKVIPMCG